jgi:hypothetical protein
MVWSSKSTGGWINIIKGAAGSLKSLHLLVAEEDLGDIPPITIQLPELRFLSFALSKAIMSWATHIPLKLATPNLECYEEQSEVPALMSLHEDTTNITELILNSTKARSMDSMSNLRRLHLNLKSPGGMRTMAVLATDTDVCPKLEDLILYHAGTNPSALRSAVAQRITAKGRPMGVIHSDISFLEFDPGKFFEYMDVSLCSIHI